MPMNPGMEPDEEMGEEADDPKIEAAKGIIQAIKSNDPEALSEHFGYLAQLSSGGEDEEETEPEGEKPSLAMLVAGTKKRG